jgi:uncharacterized membrane protein YwaF
VKNKEYFWKQLNHVPEGVGYGHFSSAHFLLLGITLALSLVVAYIYRISTAEVRSVIRIAIAGTLLLSEIIKYSAIVITHGDLRNYLPLEVCSLAGYLMTVDSLQKGTTFITEMLLIIFLPAAFMALIYPTTVYLPLHNFFTYHQFLFHGLIVAYVLSRFFAGEIPMDYKGVWLSILTMVLIALFILMIDKKFNKNFMFLIHDEKNTMLMKITKICGSGVRYTVGLILFCILGTNISYLIFKVLERIFLR